MITSVRSCGLLCSKPQPAASLRKVREWWSYQVVARWWAGPSPEPSAVNTWFQLQWGCSGGLWR